MIPAVRLIDGAITAPLLVFLQRGAVGAHVGVVYTIDEPRFLHLAWHLQLRDEPPSPACQVDPSLSEFQLKMVAQRAAVFAALYRDGMVPYGLDSAGVRILEDGSLHLGERHGLTCASFVSILFESVNLPLIDVGTWGERSPERQEEDRAAQVQLIAYLRSDHPEQAGLIEAEVGCVRVRPEEIAVAFGMQPHPVGFASAAQAGAAVRVAALGLLSK